MHRFLSRLLKRRDREGQGLVEYALILVLVAIVVIGILSLLGPAIGQTYCSVIYNVDKSAAAKAKQCKKPLVTCTQVHASPLVFEAVVIDPDKPTTVTLTQDIDVQFFVNGSTSPYAGHTEFEERFCFPNGSTSSSTLCPASASATVPSGSVVRAVATDRDGNQGECTITAP